MLSPLLPRLHRFTSSNALPTSTRLCGLAVLFLALEVVYGLDVQRSPRFQPMVPPLRQNNPGKASTSPHTLLGEHSLLLKRAFSDQIHVLAPVPDESPPCGATGCLTYCCTAEQNCCLNGCMPDDGSICHQTGYCAAGWDSCGATACYPLGVGATCCSTLGTYCEADYQCTGSIITGYSCDAVGSNTNSSSSTTSSPATSPSSTPMTPEATSATTSPVQPATTVNETTVLQLSATTDTIPVESTVPTSEITSIAQSPSTVDTTAVVPASMSTIGPSASTSSNTLSSGGQRTVARNIEMFGWASISMAFVSFLAARL